MIWFISTFIKVCVNNYELSGLSVNMKKKTFYERNFYFRLGQAKFCFSFILLKFKSFGKAMRLSVN